RTVIFIIVLLDFALMYSGVAGSSWAGPASVAYCLAWIPMLWFWYAVHLATVPKAMWIGAWTGRPGYAALQAMRSHFWVLIWLAVQVLSEFSGVSFCLIFSLPPAPPLPVFPTRPFFKKKLPCNLRPIPPAPPPAIGDKQFKGWNPRRIYPPGLWGN